MPIVRRTDGLVVEANAKNNRKAEAGETGFDVGMQIRVS